MKSNFKGKTKANLVSGFTMVEMIIYVAVLALLLAAVINALIGMTQTFNRIRAARDINHSAHVALERFVRETRDAQSIDTVASVFDAHPGNITLTNPDSSTVEFSASGTDFFVIDSTSSSPLNVSTVSLNSLIFRHIQATSSEAVRIELTLEAVRGDVSRTETFYTTAVLRNSYENEE